ncbi:MAG: glycerol-3-phosphate 1-O-acyltransferase PlsY [Candidatus Gastranaerophilales bacterium]|nr:glycerol-3-phosphate 1-O-acyltransferase PlsY [Candidatus Gastranaerophilales bacterium]
MNFQILFYIIGIVAAAYLIGSISTGYILVKAVKGIDIRNEGSGSTGATNVKRILGTWAFFVVMFIDLLKGFLPVFAAKYLEHKFNIFPQISILPVLVSLGVIIGHSRSIFLNFTGGKSVASGVGTIFGLFWPAGILTAIIWSAITYSTKIVSIGSIVALLLTPVWMFVFHQPLSYIVYCLAGGIYITLYLHRDNIKRLITGKESKVR